MATQHPQPPSESASESAAAQPSVPAAVGELARRARRVTVLTGAGMSAESGVPTFRDAQTGLWSRYDPQQLATPQAWRRDRDLVWAWYTWRAALVRRVKPNAGHHALANWATLPGRQLRIATQNVDDLHERAGSTVLAHVHGSLFAYRCERCQAPHDGPGPADLDRFADATDATDASPASDATERLAPPACPGCGAAIRPGVVWFGEALPETEFAAAANACRDADLVLVVGTSGIVYPFAALPGLAAEHGVPVVEINPVPTALTHTVDHSWRATAATALPALMALLTDAR